MSGNLAAGLLLMLAGLWLFVRTWFGGLAERVAQGVQGGG